MSAVGFDPYSVTIGLGIGYPVAPPVPTDPAKEYVASGFGTLGARVPQILPHSIDTLTQQFGTAVYESMLVDPAAGPSFNTLKMAILAGGMKLIPAVKRKGPAGVEDLDPKLADEICALCQRSLDRLERPVESWLFEMLNALAFGHTLAEIVFEEATEGPDKGKLVLRCLKVKPRWAWHFVIDPYLNILGILALVPAITGIPLADGSGPGTQTFGGMALIPRSKFALLSWDTRNADPRGHSILRMAYDWWNLKRQLIGIYWKGLAQFGTPSLVGKTAPNATDVVQADKTTLSAQADYLKKIEAFQAGSAIAIPDGAELAILESSRDGTMVERAIELCDRKMVHAILLQIRATMEAKHGSKADGETGQDILGIFVRYARRWLTAMVERDVLRKIVEVNYGKDAAESYVPTVTLGEVEHQDFVAYGTAIALLYQSDYFTEAQLAYLDGLLGLPIRDPGDERIGPAADAASRTPTTPPADPARPETKPAKGVAA